MITVPLTQGYATDIDDADADLAGLGWYANVQSPNVYAALSLPHHARAHLHRVIMARIVGRVLKSHEIVDHIDGNGLNNCRINLRLCTRAEDLRNRRMPKHNTSGYKGVSWDKQRGMWIAIIRAHKTRHYLGHYDDPIEAAKAYDTAARDLHGDFARLNFAPSALG